MSSMVQNVGLYAGCMRVVRSKTIGKGGGGLPNAGVKRAKAGRIVYQEDKTRIHSSLSASSSYLGILFAFWHLIRRVCMLTTSYLGSMPSVHPVARHLQRIPIPRCWQMLHGLSRATDRGPLQLAANDPVVEVSSVIAR